MKNSFTKLYGLAAILLSGALVFNSCKDDDDDEQKSPVIELINPAEGQIGETVTISGENFTAEGKTTKVKFGTTEVTPTENTVSTITVKVPELEPGNVDVMVSCGEQASAPKTFKVLKVQPIEFSDFEPKKGKYQTEIAISGKNFNDKVKVYINGKEQTEKAVNSEGTEIKVKLAKQTGSGKIVLKRDGEDDKEHKDKLEYEFKYKVEDFSIYGGADVAVTGDGSLYLTYHNGLVKINDSGEIIDTLIPLGADYATSGLFLAEDGTLYITDLNGMILEIKKGTKKIDTLIDLDNKDLGIFGIHFLTGDNNGNLYASGFNNKTVIKVDIKNQTTKVMATVDEKTHGITLVNGKLYVTANHSFFSLAVDSDTPKTIIGKSSGYYFGNSDVCSHSSGDFYIVDVNEDSGGIFRVNSDSEISKVSDEKARGMDVDKEGNLFIIASGSIKKVLIE